MLKNPKICQKTLKPRFQNMKCMNVKGLEAYQVKKFLKKLEKSLRNKDWSELRKFGRENKEVLREISNEMSFGLHRELK